MSNVQQAFKFAPQQIISFQITPHVNLFKIVFENFEQSTVFIYRSITLALRKNLNLRWSNHRLFLVKEHRQIHSFESLKIWRKRRSVTCNLFQR